MTVLHFDSEQFFSYLKKNNCTQCCDDYVNEDVIVFENNGFRMPLSLRRSYYPTYVCKVCEEFNIPVPEGFEHIKEQLEAIRKFQNNSPK
jgi:hypothetical protein